MTWVGKLIWGIAVTVIGDEMFYTDKSIILSILEEIFKKLHVVMVFCDCFLSPILFRDSSSYCLGHFWTERYLGHFDSNPGLYEYFLHLETVTSNFGGLFLIYRPEKP